MRWVTEFIRMKNIYKISIAVALVPVLIIVLMQWNNNNESRQSSISIQLPTEPQAVPAYVPLKKEELMDYEKEKQHMEVKMKKIMAEFNENLSDRETQAKLSAAMNAEKEEYKKLVEMVKKNVPDKEIMKKLGV